MAHYFPFCAWELKFRTETTTQQGRHHFIFLNCHLSNCQSRHISLTLASIN